MERLEVNDDATSALCDPVRGDFQHLYARTASLEKAKATEETIPVPGFTVPDAYLASVRGKRVLRSNGSLN